MTSGHSSVLDVEKTQTKLHGLYHLSEERKILQSFLKIVSVHEVTTRGQCDTTIHVHVLIDFFFNWFFFETIIFLFQSVVWLTETSNGPINVITGDPCCSLTTWFIFSPLMLHCLFFGWARSTVYEPSFHDDMHQLQDVFWKQFSCVLAALKKKKSRILVFFKIPIEIN